jgi:hypothetical protein
MDVWAVLTRLDHDILMKVHVAIALQLRKLFVDRAHIAVQQPKVGRILENSVR